MLSTIIQDSKEVLEETVSEEKTLSIYKLIMDGGLGGQIIIAILVVLLAVALYIYFERFFAIKSASKTDSNFMNQIRKKAGNMEQEFSIYHNIIVILYNLIDKYGKKEATEIKEINPDDHPEPTPSDSTT